MPDKVFAQVLLPPAGDVSPSQPSPEASSELITARTVQAFRPDEQKVFQAKELFGNAGFETGDLVGISFPISAAPETFEAFFGVRLIRDDQGVRCRPTEQGAHGQGDVGASYELPVQHLPALAGLVSAVTFSEPPAFGPSSFS